MVKRFNAQNHVLVISPDSDKSAVIELELTESGLDTISEETGGIAYEGITNTSRSVLEFYSTNLNEPYSVDFEVVEMNLDVVNALKNLYDLQEKFTMILADRTGQSKVNIKWNSCFFKTKPKSKVTTSGNTAFNINCSVGYLERIEKIA